MRATHTDYKHPRHLRVKVNGTVLCMAPSHSEYGRLNRASLPPYPPEGVEDNG